MDQKNGYNHIQIKRLELLPTGRQENIFVICPGSASDCVETLEEISIEGKESFEGTWRKNFHMIPCLNDNPDHIKLLSSLMKKSFN